MKYILALFAVVVVLILCALYEMFECARWEDSAAKTREKWRR